MKNGVVHFQGKTPHFLETNHPILDKTYCLSGTMEQKKNQKYFWINFRLIKIEQKLFPPKLQTTQSCRICAPLGEEKIHCFHKGGAFIRKQKVLEKHENVKRKFSPLHLVPVREQKKQTQSSQKTRKTYKSRRAQHIFKL